MDVGCELHVMSAPARQLHDINSAYWVTSQSSKQVGATLPQAD